MAKKTSIGGQAVIEGVMMRGPYKTAVAVRKPDGEIEVSVEDLVPLLKRNKIFSIPILRGAVALVDSLITGIKYLQYSASFFEDEEGYEEDKLEKFLKSKLGDKAENIVMGFSLILSFIIAIGMFMLLPTFAASFLKRGISNAIVINLLEGIIRLIIFVFYIYFISKMKEIQRVFEYHGAEHKSIFCYEENLELTPENAARFKTLHPRCGTNFLIIVMMISIVAFSFFGWPNLAVRLITRILFLPLIAGISYEIIKFLGRSDSSFARVIAYPGLMMQKLTTRQPDESQLEVALAALKAVIPPEEGCDTW
jgi:uncharacterized protein YqhQ